MPTEIVFVAEEAPAGGYTARALGASIFTEADSLEALQENVRDAVRCTSKSPSALASCVCISSGTSSLRYEAAAGRPRS
jgi:hypothetical protein